MPLSSLQSENSPQWRRLETGNTLRKNALELGHKSVVGGWEKGDEKGDEKGNLNDEPVPCAKMSVQTPKRDSKNIRILRLQEKHFHSARIDIRYQQKYGLTVRTRFIVQHQANSACQ